MVGLQGSGKTTTAAKLANILRKDGKKPLLVACDVYRPAAIKQLQVLGAQLNLPVYANENSQDVVKISKQAIEQAISKLNDVIIIDTAGRLQIDEVLMEELKNLKSAVKPHEILLVVDSMTGQEAVNVAESFKDAVGIDGIVLTKLDGDTRGGAALSVKKVTGRPIKYIATGEKMNDIEQFHPDRMANRLLGMGDVLSLIEKAQEAIDEKEDEALVEDLLSDEKELSEHNMLVDLGRNDLGRISEFGSIEVTKYKMIHKYSKIMHICSQVESNIRSNCDGLSEIESVLPAGTLSGAPKIRACEIIEELESEQRGIYGGALGYLDFTGNLDTCIGIRLAYKKNGKVFVRSGAGIVADSIPEKEFQECINKAKAVVEAIKKAQQMAAYEGKENDDDTID